MACMHSNNPNIKMLCAEKETWHFLCEVLFQQTTVRGRTALKQSFVYFEHLSNVS